MTNFISKQVFTASDKPDFSRHDNLGFNGLVDPSKALLLWSYFAEMPRTFTVLHLQERYQAELSLMVERGYRAEIEALYCHGFDFLGKYIAKKIVQADYI
ncbi:hypothetical protein BHE74_00005684 [Ensete ventricosum]|nr:hypothetical protein BHE74_00005684 [Ensete ventricosum]